MPEVWVYNNWKHHVVVKISTDRIVYNKVLKCLSIYTFDRSKGLHQLKPMLT